MPAEANRITEYREIIKRIICEVAAYQPTYGEVEVETVFDDDHGHYELLYTGALGQDAHQERPQASKKFPASI